MAIEIDGHWYEIIIGTDVSVKNGAFIEMHALDALGRNPFLFAFRSNADGKVTISMYREDVPIEVLTCFLQVVTKELAIDHWPLWENPE